MSLRRQKESAMRLWVLREPGEIVEYDPSTFTPKQTVRIPPQALQRPDYLAVSSGGWILFDPGSQAARVRRPDSSRRQDLAVGRENGGIPGWWVDKDRHTRRAPPVRTRDRSPLLSLGGWAAIVLAGQRIP